MNKKVNPVYYSGTNADPEDEDKLSFHSSEKYGPITTLLQKRPGETVLSFEGEHLGYSKPQVSGRMNLSGQCGVKFNNSDDESRVSIMIGDIEIGTYKLQPKRVSRLRRYWNKVKALIGRLRASESED